MKDKNHSKRQSPTRQHLIDAAGKLFSEKGFAATSIRDICQLAEVNIASTHYHFGDKAGLYDAVLRRCMEQQEKAFPKPVFDPQADPEIFLNDYIFTILSATSRSLRPDWQTELLRQEMFAPSKEFLAFMDEHILGPDFRIFTQVFQRIQPSAGPDAVRTAVTGVFGMMSSYLMPSLPFEKLAAATPGGKMTEAECAAIAFFIAQSCIAGFKALSARNGADHDAL